MRRILFLSFSLSLYIYFLAFLKIYFTKIKGNVCNKKENLSFMLEILSSIYRLKFYDHLYKLHL